MTQRYAVPIKCGDCGRAIELGSPVTSGCSECMKQYLILRLKAEQQGIKLPNLIPAAIKLREDFSNYLRREGQR